MNERLLQDRSPIASQESILERFTADATLDFEVNADSSLNVGNSEVLRRCRPNNVQSYDYIKSSLTDIVESKLVGIKCQSSTEKMSIEPVASMGRGFSLNLTSSTKDHHKIFKGNSLYDKAGASNTVKSCDASTISEGIIRQTTGHVARSLAWDSDIDAASWDHTSTLSTDSPGDLNEFTDMFKSLGDRFKMPLTNLPSNGCQTENVLEDFNVISCELRPPKLKHREVGEMHVGAELDGETGSDSRSLPSRADCRMLRLLGQLKETESNLDTLQQTMRNCVGVNSTPTDGLQAVIRSLKSKARLNKEILKQLKPGFETILHEGKVFESHNDWIFSKTEVATCNSGRKLLSSYGDSEAESSSHGDVFESSEHAALFSRDKLRHDSTLASKIGLLGHYLDSPSSSDGPKNNLDGQCDQKPTLPLKDEALPLLMQTLSGMLDSKSEAGIKITKLESCCAVPKLESHTFDDQTVQHLNTYRKERQFNCCTCGRKFTRAGNLKIHERIHTGEKPYACDKCGRKFTQQGNLKMHIISVHTNERSYICQVCKKAFRDSSSLATHHRVHSGEKPFECKDCGKRFTQKCNLKTHMLTHTGERPYICVECGEGFTQISNLKTHRRLHSTSDRKPFKCAQCDKCFTQQSNLKIHMRIHSGEKPHQCKECGKNFTQQGNLRTHMKIHSGEKRHICTYCGKGFIQLSNLKMHYVVHTGEKPHKCETCGTGFSQSSNLKSHIKLKHMPK